MNHRRRGQEEDDGDDSKPPPTRSASSIRHQHPDNGSSGSSSGYYTVAFNIGDRVVIHNLVNAEELNGRHGNIVSYNASTDRYTVEMDGGGGSSTIAIKPKNLQRETTATTVACQHEDHSPVTKKAVAVASAGKNNFAETFPDTSSPPLVHRSSTLEKTNVKAATGDRATVPGAVRASGNDNFAEVFPDTSSSPQVVNSSSNSEIEKTNAKTRMGNRAIVPGAVPMNNDQLYEPRSSCKFGDDEGLKPLAAPPLLGAVPEMFDETTGAGEAAANVKTYPPQQAKKKDLKGDNGYNNSATSNDEEAENWDDHHAPGAQRVDGLNHHDYDDGAGSGIAAMVAAGAIGATPIHDQQQQQQDLAIAAEVAPDAEDIEAQVQKRLEREAENIEEQVHQRILDEAVQADVYEDDTDEKLGRMKRWMIVVVCCVILIAVVLVIVFVVILDSGGDDSGLTANPTLSPTLSLLPSSSPTLTPSISPTFSPTPIPECTLCYDGTIPANITRDFPLGGGTCADYMEDQANFNALQSECIEGQALAWLGCGCPTLPPPPSNAECSFCFDRSIPTEGENFTYFGQNCSQYDTFIRILGESPIFSCSQLNSLYIDQDCECSGGVDDEVRLAYFTSVLQPISGDVILDETSPQNEALVWLVSKDRARLTEGTATNEEIQQRYVAALFYFALDGSSWTTNYFMLAEGSVCTWNDGNNDGFFCNDDELVYWLSLPGNNLSGPLPKEIATLTALTVIELSKNSISGTIPPNIADLTLTWKFDVYSNSMTGTLPESMFGSPVLKELWLDENNWSSESLIPSVIGNAKSLEWLSCRSCNLVSSIPESISDISPLRIVDLQNNSLTGVIPSFSKNTKMELLYLRTNNLEGSIPASLGNLTTLQELFLNGNSLNGTLPREVGNLPSLQTIDANQNLLTGPIPPFSSTELYEVWLYGNRLSGNLDEFFQSTTVSSNLRIIRFDDNFLTGTISSDIARLTSLKFVNLGTPNNILFRQNSFNGTIPTVLPPEIEELYLNNNKMTGAIPTTLGTLTTLAFLDLTLNTLTGSVPSELGNCSALKGLSVAQNLLNGTFPSSVANLPNLNILWVQGNSFTGNFDNVFCRREDPIDQLSATCSDSPCGCCTACCSTSGSDCVAAPPSTLSPTVSPTVFVPTLAPIPTAAPSQMPTIACESGTSLFRVSLLLDDYPNNTSWDIYNIQSNSTVLQGGSYKDGIGSITEETCLQIDTSCFVFTLHDLNSNEVFGREGASYMLFLDGEEIAAGDAVIGSSINKQFGDSCPPTGAPSPSPSTEITSSLDCDETAGFALLRVTLTLDLFPEQVNWNILDSSFSLLFLEGPYIAGVDSLQTFVNETCVEINNCYIFTISDSNSDGICCGESGNGEYSLFFNGEVIKTGGEFGALEQTFFGDGC